MTNKTKKRRNPLRQVMVSVYVTSDDIDKGVQSSCWMCPVALALRRVLRKGELADVHHCNVTVRDQGYTMPKRARNFVYMFDESCDVKPFKFRMPLPAAALLPSVLKRSESK